MDLTPRLLGVDAQHVVDAAANSADLDVLGATWAASGVMALTGRPDGPPLGAPAGLLRTVTALGASLRTHAQHRGHVVEVDAMAMLGERAALAGLRRGGDISCGGATRLLPTGDGTWIALALARPSDIELLAAWLPGSNPLPTELSESTWSVVAAHVAERDSHRLVEQASLLGLPCARLAETSPGSAVTATPRPEPATFDRRRDGRDRADRPLVVDLSALWAGPLCTHLLGLAGARIVKVESSARPDGARAGTAAFFDLLHAGHEHVALDFDCARGRQTLRALADHADVVVTASRPRALEQLGVTPDAVDGPQVWLAITAHGTQGHGAGRVGFGDDIAVAAGLVAADDRGPCFLGDAIADPLGGLFGAVAVLDRLAAGGRWSLELDMSRAAATAATGPTVGLGQVPRAPRGRTPTGRAPAFGEHTDAVLREFALVR